jgi:two-component system, LytTR family, response regulator
MRAFIVDDEDISRNTLKYMITQYCPEITIVGESDDFTDAVLQIQKTKTNIIFLDINLGGGKTGFNILDTLRDYKGAVIFVTAYQEFALKAFQYAAVHYIMKPIDPIDLRNAVNRIIKEENTSTSVSVDVFDQKVALPYKNGYEIILADDILYIEGDGSYANVILIDDRVINVSRNMKFVAGKLTTYPQFMQVHKSYIINKKYITTFIRVNGRALELNNKYKIPVSLTYKDDVFNLCPE